VDRNAALCLALDVTKEGHWARAMDTVLERFGRLDVLVNNAGLALTKSLEETTLDEWRQVMAVNLDGAFLGTRAAIGVMKETGGGAIVNLSSAAGLVGAPMLAAYSAAKGGLRLFTKSAALYCAEQRYGIRVNSLHPGFTDTAMLDSIAEVYGEAATVKAKLAKRQPLGRLAEPEEVARAALYLASDEAAYMTGAELVLDGGFTAQ
jgi:NAD(P)-dependent dehydrogenase (short-subunit alcohol dehydrogenase family)